MQACASRTPKYCLKIINPNNASGEIIIDNLALQPQRYVSVEDLRKKLFSLCSKYIDGYDMQLGYISPGHGMKGKQQSIDSDEDLVAMYSIHQKKRISFWLKCKPPKSRKRSLSEPAVASQNKRQTALLDMMNGVEAIIDQLKLKHGAKYTPVQFNCWAHMIHTNKHESLDTPPNKSFFGKKASDPVGVSPSKRISLRSECINQLDKWHQLMERGVISDDQYKELQDKIFKDIKKF